MSTHLLNYFGVFWKVFPGGDFSKQLPARSTLDSRFEFLCPFSEKVSEKKKKEREESFIFVYCEHINIFIHFKFKLNSPLQRFTAQQTQRATFAFSLK